MAKKGKKDDKKKKGADNAAKEKKKLAELAAVREGLLNYQLESKKKQFERLTKDVELLKLEVEKKKERNTHLKKESEENFQKLLAQTKQQEREIENNQIYNSSHVEEALKSLWDATTREEKIEEALIAKQSEVDKAIAAKQSQVDFWRCFKNVGSKDNKAKIDLLQSELKKLEKTHNETMEHLKMQSEKTLREIQERTAEKIEHQLAQASERSIRELDQKSLQEIRDNKMLRREVDTHRAESDEMSQRARVLEEKNLKIVSELLASQVEDLHLHTNPCPDKLKADAETVAGDLKMSLDNISPGNGCPCSLKRGELCNLESKLAETQDLQINIHDGAQLPQLGPMELKLLHVSGNQKILHSGRNVMSPEDKARKEKLEKASIHSESRAKFPLKFAAYKSFMSKNGF